MNKYDKNNAYKLDPSDYDVEEEYRNFGIATHLIELCEKWAKEQGITQIASDCEIDNLDSINLHLSNGFHEKAKSVHFIKNI